MTIKFYNNKIKPHLLNFPKLWYGKIEYKLYCIKLFDLVCEIEL